LIGRDESRLILQFKRPFSDFESVTDANCGKAVEVKLADFGLSALVRVGEDDYDEEYDEMRKGYNRLSDVSMNVRL
jgi:hypothetical protein